MFNHKYNTDNVFSRSIIVGLINLLNNKIQIPNILDTGVVDIIEIPWFFSQGGDERFMQDYFENWSDCLHPLMADGNYDIIPRGNVKLASENINSGALTHRFVRGRRVREIGGQLHTFSSYLNSIPMNYTFEASIKTDTYLDALKITQTIREVFYSTQIFYTRYDGFKIPCQAGFPEDLGIEKTFEYTYADDTQTMVNFSIEVECYQPVTDKTSEMSAANIIEGFATYTSVDTECGDDVINIDLPLKSIDFTTLNTSVVGQPNTYYVSNVPIDINWTSIGTITKVDIYYRINDSNWVISKRFTKNSDHYSLVVPENKNNFDIIFSEDVKKKAVIRPFFDSQGKLTAVNVIEGGYGYTEKLNIDIDQNNFTGHSCEIQPIIENGIITDIKIIDPGSGYDRTTEYKLDIKVVDSRDNSIADSLLGLVII